MICFTRFSTLLEDQERVTLSFRRTTCCFVVAQRVDFLPSSILNSARSAKHRPYACHEVAGVFLFDAQVDALSLPLSNFFFS